MTTQPVIIDDQTTHVEAVVVPPVPVQVEVAAAQQAQALVVSVDPGQVQVTVPGPFGTRIFVGPNPPDDTTVLWLDTRSIA